MNESLKMASQYPPHIPRKGDLVVGQVISVGDRIATILLSAIIRLDKQNKIKEFFPVTSKRHAYLFKGDANYPCMSLSEILKIGDIILGTVKIDWFTPIFIALDSQITGIVAGVCNKCGLVLPTPKNPDRLVCPRCKNIRKTKISILYDAILWREIQKVYSIKTIMPA